MANIDTDSEGLKRIIDFLDSKENRIEMDVDLEADLSAPSIKGCGYAHFIDNVTSYAIRDAHGIFYLVDIKESESPTGDVERADKVRATQSLLEVLGGIYKSKADK